MVEYTYHHLHLKTKDPEGVAKWLVDNFGAVEISRSLTPGPFLRIRVNLGGGLILINGSVSEEGYQDNDSELRYGMDHYGLAVKDLDAAYAELTAKGVKFVEAPRPFGNIRIAYVLTPDNVRVELMELKEG